MVPRRDKGEGVIVSTLNWRINVFVLWTDYERDNVLFSGQVRLIRSGGADAFEVRLDQSTGSDNDVDVSDEDFYSPLRSRSPPMPRGTLLC